MKNNWKTEEKKQSNKKWRNRREKRKRKEVDNENSIYTGKQERTKELERKASAEEL